MKKRSKKKKNRKIWGFLKFQMILIVLVVLAIAYYYAGGYATQISDMKTEAIHLVAKSNEDTFKQGQTSVAYDADDNILAVLKGDKDAYYVEDQDIPIYIKQAIVATEDKRFYKHKGIDFRGIMRAVVAIVKEGEVTQGGSTITQQLARTIYLSNERTWERKVEEMYIAAELEQKYTKDQILEFYINNVYFGDGYYGIQAAAEGYFGTDISHLSLSQMIYLCAIPNNPTLYNPRKNPSNTIERRNRILKTMLDEKIISEDSYNTAITEDIKVLEKDTEETINNYAESYTYYCAARALMEMEGFEFEYTFDNEGQRVKYQSDYNALYSECYDRLFSGGYRIYTSINPGQQEALQKAVDDNLASFGEMNEDGVYELQGSAVCIDNKTGMVTAIVGGRSQEMSGLTLNRAYQSFRQPGSSIKPLIVYTPALERGYTPDTVVVDEPIDGGPVNGDGSYAGNMTLRNAVAYSKNTIAWKIFDELTPQVGIEYLENMGFVKLESSDKRLPASIGGFTNGVSALEMAKGYATIVNNGGYRNPSCVTKITDASGEVLYQADQTEQVIYQENACRQMTDMLQSVIDYGTGRGYKLGNMPCAGKTGTTNDNKDGWFVGYTPYYTTSVWVGYDIPKTVEGLGGGTYPGRIWYQYMQNIHRDLPYTDFVKPISDYEQPEETKEEEPQDEEELSEGGMTPDMR
ncbi:MAG: penicillin-binding protein [Lachnospiraceae bacterium]|nr:penicillin-binding protein [Lachnospiraceae bacterium]